MYYKCIVYSECSMYDCEVVSKACEVVSMYDSVMIYVS